MSKEEKSDLKNIKWFMALVATVAVGIFARDIHQRVFIKPQEAKETVIVLSQDMGYLKEGVNDIKALLKENAIEHKEFRRGIASLKINCKLLEESK